MQRWDRGRRDNKAGRLPFYNRCRATLIASIPTIMDTTVNNTAMRFMVSVRPFFGSSFGFVVALSASVSLFLHVPPLCWGATLLSTASRADGSSGWSASVPSGRRNRAPLFGCSASALRYAPLPSVCFGHSPDSFFVVEGAEHQTRPPSSSRR